MQEENYTLTKLNTVLNIATSLEEAKEILNK